MIRLRGNKKAQAVMVEYGIVISMVIAAIVGMTVYFKRGVQARIYDARNYMVSSVRGRTTGEYDGNLYLGYEPYYTHSAANVYRTASDETRLKEGGTSGIFEKDYDEIVVTRAMSETLPPKEFDVTTPIPWVGNAASGGGGGGNVWDPED